MSDSDFGETRDDFIDSFAIDLEPSDVPAGRGMTEVMSFSGNFGFATILNLVLKWSACRDMSGRLAYLFCNTEPCSTNGTCLQSPSGFNMYL